MDKDLQLLLEDKENYVIKSDGVIYWLLIFLYIIILMVIIIETKQDSYKLENCWKLLIPIILIFYSLYKALDHSILLIISKKGIWTKKLGLTDWEEIYYFYIARHADGEGGNIYYFCIKAIHHNKEISVSLPHGELNLVLISKIINKFYQDSDKIDLGIKDMSRDI